ncbi:hypothetical protein BGW37DRAFT_520735 [Umbelopsis sp. PMI_123]|nr:hypothetical protein BGW37DRAFT_520735 [Umbelopsis sp. PMI_123]
MEGIQMITKLIQPIDYFTSIDLTDYDQYLFVNWGEPPVCGRLHLFQHAWKEMSDEAWVRSVISSGSRKPFTHPPPLPVGPLSEPFRKHSKVDHQLIEDEIIQVLCKRAIEEVSPASHGFHSQWFTIPKKTGERRPMVNLGPLNQADFQFLDCYKLPSVSLSDINGGHTSALNGICSPGDRQNPARTDPSDVDHSMVAISNMVPNVTVHSPPMANEVTTSNGPTTRRTSRKRLERGSALVADHLDHRIRRLEEVGADSNVTNAIMQPNPSRSYVMNKFKQNSSWSLQTLLNYISSITDMFDDRPTIIEFWPLRTFIQAVQDTTLR